MDERDRTTSNRNLERCEYEDLRHAYYRTRAEMTQYRKRERATGKTPHWFLENPDDWTPVAMDGEFWEMESTKKSGVSHRRRRYIASAAGWCSVGAFACAFAAPGWSAPRVYL